MWQQPRISHGQLCKSTVPGSELSCPSGDAEMKRGGADSELRRGDGVCVCVYLWNTVCAWARCQHLPHPRGEMAPLREKVLRI